MDRSHFCKAIQTFLSSSPVLSTVPSSIFLYGVEELMELKLSCPCRHEMSKRLITSIFVGPPVLLFAIVFILLNPLRYVCNEDGEIKGWQTFLKDFGHCLILPIIWVIILLLDGDYLACYWTNWEGKHVFDKEIKKMWCQPTDLVNARNESDIQHKYQTFISESQFIGYFLLGAFGLVIILIVALSNCCNKSPTNEAAPADNAEKGKNKAEGGAHGTVQETKPLSKTAPHLKDKSLKI